jgi:hypothetical protein
VADPLILTAVLDDAVQQRLDALRRVHFPPERNHLDAHVTLFHHLPGAEREAVADAVAEAVRTRAPAVDLTGVRSLGRGVAVVLASPGLAALRADLARRWDGWLTAQDRGKRGDLHVTVQNKVTPEAARALHRQLAASFAPERTRAVALALWRYAGGPWEPVARFAFAATAGPDAGETAPPGGSGGRSRAQPGGSMPAVTYGTLGDTGAGSTGGGA